MCAFCLQERGNCFSLSSVIVCGLGVVSVALFSVAVQFQRHISVIYVAVALVG